MTSCFSLSGLNFAIVVLYPIEPRSFALDSPTFSTVSTAGFSGGRDAEIAWERDSAEALKTA